MTATSHFEAGQKLNIALVASNAALTDVRSLLRRAEARPVLGQLALGISFVSRAGVTCDTGAVSFCLAVLVDIEGR